MPMILRADGAVEAVGAEGTLLGIFPDPELSDRSGKLGPGDALVLYTDGLTDQPGPEGRLGRKGIEEVLSSAVGMDAVSISACLERAVMNGSGQALQDDVALLVLRVLPSNSMETG